MQYGQRLAAADPHRASACWEQLKEPPPPAWAALAGLGPEPSEEQAAKALAVLIKDAAQRPTASEFAERWKTLRAEPDGYTDSQLYFQILDRAVRRPYAPELPEEAGWAVEIYGRLGKDEGNRTLQTEMACALDEAGVTDRACRAEIAEYWAALDEAARTYIRDVESAREQKRLEKS